MITALLLIFVAGYTFIALEHKLRINKAGIALLMSGVMWGVYALWSHADAPNETVAQLGDTCEILIFLIGAMTIVDLIDIHEGFSVITRHITTRSPRKLLWLTVTITFFMSATLDNMTTTIIIIMLLRRIIPDKHLLMLFAGITVVAANSGGVWSPIGDVTTIMLWMRGNVTTGSLITTQFLPSLVSVIIPTWWISRHIPRVEIGAIVSDPEIPTQPVPRRLSLTILILGVAGLLFVPVYKSVTGLPPYMGMMLSLGTLWVITELIYDHGHTIETRIENRVARILKHIDLPTILFFLGILMSVAVLESSGLLTSTALWLDHNVHEVFVIAGSIGLMSAIIDNVPLVAAATGMYPLPDPASLSAAADPAFLEHFTRDGLFWHLLTFSAGTGGSLLIIGSAAGVVAMGLQNISFSWYLKRISLPALAGYLAGIGVLWLEHWIGF